MYNFLRASQNAAYHITQLFTMAPGTMRCGVAGGATYEIKIEKSTMSDDPVWDQVYIRLSGSEDPFRWCGNRCGGRSVLATLYAMDMAAEFGFEYEADSEKTDHTYIEAMAIRYGKGN